MAYNSAMIGDVIKVFAPTAINAAKVIVPFAVAFIVGLVIAVPIYKFLHRKQLWKKKARTKGLGDNKYFVLCGTAYNFGFDTRWVNWGLYAFGNKIHAGWVFVTDVCSEHGNRGNF